MRGEGRGTNLVLLKCTAGKTDNTRSAKFDRQFTQRVVACANSQQVLRTNVNALEFVRCSDCTCTVSKAI